MEPLQTIVSITEVINCFNEGLTLISKFSEHYEKWSVKKHNKKNSLNSIDYDIINIKPKQVLPKPKSSNDNISVYMSEPLFNIESCRNSIVQTRNISIEPFYDDKRLNELSSVMLTHQRDSIIVIRNNYNAKLLTIQLDMLNIVPGNDDICYRISYKIKCDLKENNYKEITTSLLQNVISEIIKTYHKYQQTVRTCLDRLELEARILNQMGYTNVTYQQVEMGYGLFMHSGTKEFIIGIPLEYPRKAPTIVEMHGDSYRQIEFENTWEPFLTIGHIVKAIAGGNRINV